MMCRHVGGSTQEWSGALTLAMGKEVVSERGGGAGVIISGAHTVTAEGGAELLHACQSLCREEGVGWGVEGCQTGDKNPPGAGGGVWMIWGGGRREYTGVKCQGGGNKIHKVRYKVNSEKQVLILDSELL